MIFTEENLKTYAKPLGKTEQIQCENAIRMVIDALKDFGFNKVSKMILLEAEGASYETKMKHGVLGFDIKIFLQGSYANNTNVRGYSDVDIAIVEEDQFRGLYREHIGPANYGFINVKNRQAEFKKEVYNALIYKFSEGVEWKNKSIKINGNSYRKDIDAVPALRYRNYLKDFYFDVNNYQEGIVIEADDGTEVINYPEQHIRQGIEKNKETNYWYKKMVRVFKELRYKMEECRYPYASKISSFGVESLIFNVPNSYFWSANLDRPYISRVENIINYLQQAKVNGLFSIFTEANGIKHLCDNPKIDLEVFEEFIDELRSYFEYEL